MHMPFALTIYTYIYIYILFLYYIGPYKPYMNVIIFNSGNKDKLSTHIQKATMNNYENLLKTTNKRCKTIKTRKLGKTKQYRATIQTDKQTINKPTYTQQQQNKNRHNKLIRNRHNPITNQ